MADFEIFDVSEDNPYFSTRDGVLYTKDFKTLLSYPRSKPDKEFIVPPEVETIADEAFCRNLLLENIVIPPSVKTLGNRAFYSCKRLTNITLSEGLKQIGHDCFSNSRKVTILTIPSSITKLYTSILTAGLCVAVPDSVQSLDYDDSDHFSSGTIILVHNNPVVTAFATSGACSFVANYRIDDNGNIWSPDGVLIRFSNRYTDKTYTLPTHATGILENAFMSSTVKTIKCKSGHEVEWMPTYPPQYTAEFDTPIMCDEFFVSSYDMVSPGVEREYELNLIPELDRMNGITYDDNDSDDWMGLEDDED